MAEESAKQSKDIGNELKSVSEQIENVVGQAEISTGSFKKVDEEITATTDNFGQKGWLHFNWSNMYQFSCPPCRKAAV